MSEQNARKIEPQVVDEDQRDLADAVRGWANAADPDRKAIDDAVRGWAAAVQHPANDEDAEALLPGPFSHPPAETAGAVMASLGTATALSSAATKDPKDKPKPANPYLTPKLDSRDDPDSEADASGADAGDDTLRIIPAPDTEQGAAPDTPDEPTGVMKPVILSGAAALAASETAEQQMGTPQTGPDTSATPDPSPSRYDTVVNDEGQTVSARDYYPAAEAELDEDGDERSILMKALPFAALAAIGISFLGVMAVQGQGNLIVPEAPKAYAPAVPAPIDFTPARSVEPAPVVTPTPEPVNPVPTPTRDVAPEALTPEPEILPVPITDFGNAPADAPATDTPAPPPAASGNNTPASEGPPPGSGSGPQIAIAPLAVEPEPDIEPVIEVEIAPPVKEEPVQLAKVEPAPSPAPIRTARPTVKPAPDVRLLPPPSLKPALRNAEPSFYAPPRQPRVNSGSTPRAPASAPIGSDGTVTDLLYRRASATTTDTNFPDYWAGLGWMVGDTLSDAVDGEPRTLMVPDGRRFTMLPTGTRREMRTMTALRAEEIGQLPDGLSAGRGIMRTLRDASLRAAPSEASDGEVIDLISAGTQVQQIATLDQNAVSAWSMVGRYGIAFGFIKLSDLEKADSNTAPDSIYNRVHGPVRKDVVRVRTYCRDAVWEIGAEQGQLSACMAPDGKWLIEQQTPRGRDTVPAITEVVYE